MSQNVEQLRALYLEWAQGNFRSGRELFAEDVIYEPMAEGRESYRGREAVSGHMREFLSQWSEFRVEARDLLDAGDVVLVTERQYGKGRTSGIATEMTDFAVWTFRDGVVVRVRWEADRAAALEAAGLSE
jgi:ketosteroid isomerase-like protein